MLSCLVHHSFHASVIGGTRAHTRAHCSDHGGTAGATAQGWSITYHLQTGFLAITQGYISVADGGSVTLFKQLFKLAHGAAAKLPGWR